MDLEAAGVAVGRNEPTHFSVFEPRPSFFSLIDFVAAPVSIHVKIKSACTRDFKTTRYQPILPQIGPIPLVGRQEERCSCVISRSDRQVFTQTSRQED